MWRLILVAVLAGLVVQGEKPTTQTDTKQRDATSRAQETGKSTTGSVFVINQNTLEGKGNERSQDAPSYFHRLLSPENLPSIVLAVVGLVGIWLGMRTLKATSDNAKAAIKSAEAAAANAKTAEAQNVTLQQTLEAIQRQAGNADRQTEITRRSLRLQEAGFRQWVKLEGWKVFINSEEKKGSVHFNVLNPTDRPLYFDIMLPKIDGVEVRELIEGHATYLVPGSPFPVALFLEENRLPVFNEHGYATIQVEIAIFFRDAGGQHWQQTFTAGISYHQHSGHTTTREYKTTLRYSGEDQEEYERERPEQL